MGVPGVANVSVWGQRERQLQVLVDPARLRANDVSLQQIIETTANAQFVSNLTFVEASTPGTGGIIETPNQRFGIQHGVPFASPADLAKVHRPGHRRSAAPPGRRERHRRGPSTAHRRRGRSRTGPASCSSSRSSPGANPLDVTRGVEAALDDLARAFSGSHRHSLFRPGTYIESSSDNLTTALIIGCVAPAARPRAFLFAWRSALIAVVAIATSSLTAVLVLDAGTETTFNPSIVAGLTLALVVVIDDAVGDAENVARRMRARARAATAARASSR